MSRKRDRPVLTQRYRDHKLHDFIRTGIEYTTLMLSLSDVYQFHLIILVKDKYSLDCTECYQFSAALIAFSASSIALFSNIVFKSCVLLLRPSVLASFSILCLGSVAGLSFVRVDEPRNFTFNVDGMLLLPGLLLRLSKLLLFRGCLANGRGRVSVDIPSRGEIKSVPRRRAYSWP